MPRPMLRLLWLLAAGVAAGCAMPRQLDRTASMLRLREPPLPAAPRPASVPWRAIGTSVRGKPIEAITLGTGARRVYVLGGLHGDQPEGPAVMDRLAAALADWPAASGATIRLVRDGNPDGTAIGTRTNTRGVDLDRNWPTAGYAAGGEAGPRALSELETVAIDADLRAFAPDVVIVLGSVSYGPLATWAGPASEEAYAFASGARRADARWRVAVGETPAEGSLAALLVERHVPVVLARLRRGEDEHLNYRALFEGVLSVIGAREPARRTRGR